MLVAGWAIRLGGHLWRRTAGAEHEDARYAEFRRAWGPAFPRRLFAFLQAQAVSSMLLTLAMLAAARNPAQPFPAWSDVAGVALLAMASTWSRKERPPTRELARFKADPAHRGGVCDTGLWAWSRHPNYFFEWLGWLAYAAIAIGPAGDRRLVLCSLIGPAFMIFILLRFVSGVPPTEAAMAKSRGSAFAHYQARVSAFFPMPPRAADLGGEPHEPQPASPPAPSNERRSPTPSPGWASATWSAAPAASSTPSAPTKPCSCARWTSGRSPSPPPRPTASTYELPAALLRPDPRTAERRPYSLPASTRVTPSLADGEVRALAETATVRTPDLADGQSILELGCGWGSLSLWMAERYPASRIVAGLQLRARRKRAFIEAEARRRILGNLRVVTADMNDFATEARFDRIVSVEMFEHMSNWRALLTRAKGWLKPDGRLFLHVFTHRNRPYSFEAADEADWIAQHFFTGGIMPSHGLIRQFPDLFAVEAEWRWSGDHYRRTALHWLTNYDSNAAEIGFILREVYGDDWRIWRRRWRLFFLATAGLFGEQGGDVWGVSHYRLSPAG